MSKNLQIVPYFVSAETAEELTRKCLVNNMRYSKQFDYRNIVFANGIWYAFFNFDVKDFEREQ